jgi:hypothetical protein
VIEFEQKGDFRRTTEALENMSRRDVFGILDAFGREGVEALSSATPVSSGLTASSWSYKVSRSRGSYSVIWYNSHVVDGVPIAIILQYGHGTGTGGFVSGQDYINPAIQPVFDRMADKVWKEVTAI